MRRILGTLVLIGGAVIMTAAPAFAGSITTPSSNPFTVSGDSNGNPQPFTITVGGFTPGSHVFVEQCDGVSSTSANYDPAAHCDIGSSPSDGIADSNGNFTFSASSANFGFHPFKGESPQSIFNCLSPHDPALSPTNGLTDYRNCQLRASTSNTNVTSDQTYITLTLPDSSAVAPEVPYAALLPISALAIAGGVFVIRKRRAGSAVA